MLSSCSSHWIIADITHPEKSINSGCEMFYRQHCLQLLVGGGGTYIVGLCAIGNPNELCSKKIVRMADNKIPRWNLKKKNNHLSFSQVFLMYSLFLSR